MGKLGAFDLHFGRKMFGGSGWRNDIHDGFKEIFNLELDESVWDRDTDKVITIFCLESCFGVV